MDVKADTERVRRAFSTANGCTTDTVTTLRRLLGAYDADDDKENRQENAGSRKLASNAPSKLLSNGLKERRPVKATKPPPKASRLSAKEEQNLATELVNKTLKILTEAARSKTGQDGNLQKGNSQLSQTKLNSVATCCSIAFMTLRRLRQPASDGSNMQLEQGVLALIGKLVSLGMAPAARTELSTLRDMLEGSSSSSKRNAGAERPLEAMLQLSVSDGLLPRLKAASQYQAMILRLLGTDATTLDGETFIESLNSADGPFGVLHRMRSAGGDIHEISQSMETVARSVKSILRTNTCVVSPESSIRLEMIVLAIRREWWAMEGHQVDVIREVLEPIRLSLRSFRSNSKQSVSQQYAVVAPLYSGIKSWDMLNNLDNEGERQYLKLLASLRDMAESSGNKTEASDWMPAQYATAPGTDVASQFRGVLRDIKDDGLSEQTVADINVCLHSCQDLPDLTTELIEQLSSVRSILSAHLVKRASAKEPLQASICSCLFACLRNLQKSQDDNISHISLLEAGLLASHSWLQILSYDASTLDDFLTAQVTLHEICHAIPRKSNANLLNAFSKLQWYIHQYCKRIDISEATFQRPDPSTFLTEAVLAVEGLQLSGKDATDYSARLNELVICHLTTRKYREARKALHSAIGNFFSVNDATVLKASLDSSTVALALEKLPLGPYLVETIRLTKRLGHESRQSCLDEVSSRLDGDGRHVFFISWILSVHVQGMQCHEQDVQICMDALKTSLNPQKHPIQWAQVCQRIVCIGISQPGLLTSSIIDKASLSLIPGNAVGEDTGHKKYIDHLRYTGRIISSLRGTSQDFTAALGFWSDLLDSGVVADRVDDVEFLVTVLLSASSVLETSGDLSQAHDALDISSRLCALIRDTGCNYSAAINIAKCRNALALGDVSTAEIFASKLTNSGGVWDKQAQLEMAGLKVRLASKSTDVHRMRDTVQIALGSCTTSGLRRREKLKVFISQANIGISVARYLQRTGQISLGMQIARASLLLLRSVAAANDRSDSSPTERTGDRLGAVVEQLSNLNLSGPALVAASSTRKSTMTTDPLLVAPIFQCLLLLRNLGSVQGNRGDSQYYLEQAGEYIRDLDITELQKRLATDSLQLQVLSRHEGDTERYYSDNLGTDSKQPKSDMSSASLKLAKGDWLATFRGLEDALAHYTLAEQLLGQQVQSSTPVRRLGSSPAKASATKQAKKLPEKTSRAVKPNSKTVRAKSAAKRVAPLEVLTKAKECQTQPQVEKLLARIKQRRAVTLLKQGRLAEARQALASSPYLPGAASPFDITQARLALAQAATEALKDVNFLSLPESTLAMPSTCKIAVTSTSVKTAAKGAATKHTRHDSVRNNGIHKLLVEAQEHANLKSQALVVQGTSQIYEASTISVSTGLLLSAVDRDSTLRPDQIAYLLELAANEAFRRQVTDVCMEKSKAGLQELLEDKAFADRPATAMCSSTFTNDFLDVLPEEWTVVSLSMNEDGTELWAARYSRGETPLVLRIPMSRSRDGDMDETASFAFTDARQELLEIIKASDYSCHHPPDADVKGGKSRWWEERQNLDARMKDVLTNIEEIWFGGFKGILSLQETNSDILARFQKTFDGILDRHLPSRGTKVKREKAVLHPLILSLFVRLDLDAEENIEEHVMDLLFFVMDILHWNGEANALDEIDLDQMAVETLDAMRAYHDAAGSDNRDEKHLILRLDKRLHCFPWESMPCLQGYSVSRVASLCQLRERILAMKDSPRYTVSSSKGTYILNPSGDLQRTEDTLQPSLSPLLRGQSWSSMVQTRPDEASFAEALSSSSTLLYFGHGSGTQYIRERAIQKLDRCAPVVWLMGCSSGTASEHGQLETTSVPLSYLVAGKADVSDFLEKGREGLCMSVVATLWDVTDKDIDKFTLAVGEQWGLFAQSEGETAPPKTPRKKGKEPPKTPGKTPRGKKGKTVESNGHDQQSISLPAAVAKSRDVCYLRYLNGAASVVYGVPVYLDK